MSPTTPASSTEAAAEGFEYADHGSPKTSPTGPKVAQMQSKLDEVDQLLEDQKRKSLVRPASLYTSGIHHPRVLQRISGQQQYACMPITVNDSAHTNLFGLPRLQAGPPSPDGRRAMVETEAHTAWDQAQIRAATPSVRCFHMPARRTH
eukprot:SAG31_NODE_1090_length_9967_cov_66.880726_7_plen_149_part_00